VLMIPLDQQIQPYHPDFKEIIVVIFPKSKSQYLQNAIDIAKQASLYCENTLSGTPYHFCGFKLTREQIQYCIPLIQMVSSWKGSYMFINNRLVSSYSLMNTLTCFYESHYSPSIRAYCCPTVDKLVLGDDSTWIHPCKIVCTQQQYINKMNIKSPIPLKDQVIAKAAELGCDWCPNFKPDQLSRTGLKTKSKFKSRKK